MAIILLFIGVIFLLCIFDMIGKRKFAIRKRKVGVELQDILTFMKNNPRESFGELDDNMFEGLLELSDLELKEVVLGKAVEVAMLRGFSMDQINSALSNPLLVAICSVMADDVIQRMRYY